MPSPSPKTPNNQAQRRRYFFGFNRIVFNTILHVLPFACVYADARLLAATTYIPNRLQSPFRQAAC